MRPCARSTIASFASTFTTAGSGDMLISASDLSRVLERVTVLDIRWDLATGPDREAYEAGHIPAAAFVDLDAALAGRPGDSGRHPLPTAEAFQEGMRGAGVSRGKPVVVYDARTSASAARAWWLLAYFGHPDVTVLDGGLAAWSECGLELEQGTATPSAGDFTAREGALPILDAAGAAELARTGVLIDARAPQRFRGEREPVDPVAGHIPGAVNRPAPDNLDERGRFQPPAALRQGFRELGVRDGVGVGAYCGSGVTAAHEVLALRLAGFPAALYAGSWSEWITDPSRPISTGP
jgi:thiosulfate/3-mercaptopyruvate sulfurtransferase